MQAGLMQSVPLQISALMKHAARAHAQREIVSRLVDEPIWRYTYREFSGRTARAANLLRRIGVAPGDRVTSLAWNTHRHLELFYAVPGLGAILHTANPRLSDEQIIYTVNHAQSAVLFFDRTFSALIERIRGRLISVRVFIMLSDAERLLSGTVGASSYEALIERESDAIDWPVFDENTGAFLCYTSGTTGDPKGVVYSHRSVVLHALAAGLSGAFGFDAFDVIMPCSSLYHATAWGLPFVALLNGCKLVLPGDRMDPAGLSQLIQDEGVTFSGGVPTIWTMYLDHLHRTGENTGQLKRIVIGGSAVPRAMAQTFVERYGVRVLQIWGMTETSPLGVVATPTPAVAQLGEGEANEIIWSRQGRIQFGLELKIVGEDGAELPWDGRSAGMLLVRGPWVIERYYRAEHSALDDEGWFDTGDIATVDENGFLRITDRSKDVIKSGGEWVSSIDIENAMAGCPGVRAAAVVGVAHPKWEERPILVIEPHEGAVLTEAQVRAFLEPCIVKWWMPDLVVFAAVPLTATGKINKRALRLTYGQALTPISN